MSDELWLRELAQANRDKQVEEGIRFDERWDRLSAGTLSPEEEAELRALAETSEEAREAYEAFRPLGPGFQASIVQAIRKQGLTPAETKSPEPPAKLLPFRRRGAWAGWSAAAAAAAAALFLFLRNPAPPPPLPVYSMEVSGGVSAMRGEGDEVEVFAPGDRCRVVLRPDRPIAQADEHLAAHCLLSRAGDLRRLEATSKLDPRGSVMMEVLIDRNVQPGTWTLLAIVGRRGKLPDLDHLRRFSAQTQIRQEDWIAISKEIRIQNRDLPP